MVNIIAQFPNLYFPPHLCWGMVELCCKKNATRTPELFVAKLDSRQFREEHFLLLGFCYDPNATMRSSKASNCYQHNSSFWRWRPEQKWWFGGLRTSSSMSSWPLTKTHWIPQTKCRSPSSVLSSLSHHQICQSYWIYALSSPPSSAIYIYSGEGTKFVTMCLECLVSCSVILS